MAASTSHSSNLSSSSNGYPFTRCQKQDTDQFVENSMSIEDACKVLLNSKDVIQNVKKLYHKKASEVVVFTLSDTDRTWKRESRTRDTYRIFFQRIQSYNGMHEKNSYEDARGLHC